MNRAIKVSVIGFSVLSGFILSGYLGFEIGADSERSKNRTRENLLKMINVKPKPCRSEYGNANRKWDCTSKGTRNIKEKNCALSLAVVESDNKALAFIDDLELNAEYSVQGLTQVWKFEDGSRYELEPNGEAKYKKVLSESSERYIDPDNKRYECKIVKT